MQTVYFILVSANSESLSGVQLDPTWYDYAVKYACAMRVNKNMTTQRMPLHHRTS